MSLTLHLHSGTRLVANIAANFAGRASVAITYLLLSPIYMHMMGLEAFGAVGLFLSLYALISLLDLGLGAAATRQIAALSAVDGRDQRIYTLIVTLEWMYWAVACLIAFGGTIVAPWIAGDWLNPVHMEQEALTSGMVAMAFALASQFPYALYSGALSGLQRQVLQNTIAVGVTILRGLLSVAALYVSPTLESFFWAQTTVNVVQAGMMRYYVNRHIRPAKSLTGFSIRSVHSIWRFALGLATISALSTILNQSDKIVLSKTLALESFAHYSVAWLLASGLNFVATPFLWALYPRFCELLAVNDADTAMRIYNRASRLISTLVFPLGLTLAFFPTEILFLWTRNSDIAREAGTVLTLLSLGTMFGALATASSALQLAHGWTDIMLKTSAIAAVLLLPSTIYMAVNFGAIYVAMVWLTVNALSALAGVYVLHKRLAHSGSKRSFAANILSPFFGSLAVILPLRVVLPSDLGNAALLIFVGLSVIFGTVSAHSLNALVFRRAR